MLIRLPGSFSCAKILVRIGLLAVCLAAFGAGYVYWRVTRFDPLIRSIALRHRLDEALVKAIVHEESWYNPNSLGENGEIGLMQISAVAAREYTNSRKEKGNLPPDLFDPGVNLQIGCWYLRQSIDLFRDYPDPVPLAIARYNAGESRVRQWIRAMGTENNRMSSAMDRESIFLLAIQIPSTRDYVRRVLRRYRSRSFFAF